MNLQQRIRQWLGIVDITHNQQLLDIKFASYQRDLGIVRANSIAANRGIGRLIAKLDPNYAKDELDPVRKAESDRISEEVIKKLISEHLASNRTQS